MKKQVAYLQKLFYDLWNDFGGVYLMVNHSNRTRIGTRGFTEDEKRQGLVLVFNNKTNAELSWDEEGNLSCVLAFGSRKEDVYVFHDDLRGVFSPEANVQFFRSDGQDPAVVAPEPELRPASGKGAKESGGNQVVSMSNFKKRKTEGK